MYLNDEEYPEAEHRMEDCTLWFVEFTIRVNDHCKDKDKEVNAASVVNVSEQETHRSQELSMKTKTNKAVQLCKRVNQKRLL